MDNYAYLWQLGRTAWQLPPTPLAVYNQVVAGRAPFLVLAHRNFHKTQLAITIADERCRRKPEQPWAVILKTKEHAADVVEPAMRYYLRTCPAHLRPKPVQSRMRWVYPNGSGLYFFGSDHEHIETVRGRGFAGVVFDEMGHQKNVKHNVKSVVLPALAKLGEDGMAIGITTPSTEPGHDFEALWEEAKLDGRAVFMPVENNPDLSPDWIDARAAECGGYESLDFLREYRCQFVTDPSTTVLPGVTRARIEGTDGKPALVQKVPIRTDREWYCSMDIGGKHLTFLGWGYYEPQNDTVYIARELADRNASSPELAREIVALEAALFGEHRPQYLHRWADNNNLFLLHDLARQYRLSFRATRKDQKMAQVGSLRTLIADGRFVIDESCKLLLQTLKTAQWRQTGNTDSGFAEDPQIGHADALDMSLYLVRNVHRRPYPLPTLSLEQQMGMPGAQPLLPTPGLRRMAELLREEPGWQEFET